MSGTGGFQTQATPQPALAIAGDFASQNPYFSLDVGAGGLVAGSSGVQVGLFAWIVPPLDPEGTPTICNNFGIGNIAGFVSRMQQGLITQYLAYAGMIIQPGFQMSLMTGGDFWIVNNGATQAVRGQKAYANFTNGQASFAATGAPSTAASATGCTITPETFSVTGSIGGQSGNILTVTSVGSGTIYPGATISGGATASGTEIVSQISGSPGGVGTYYVSIPEQTVASTTISGTYGLLTIGTLSGSYGNFQVGQVLTVSGSVVAGTSITANVSGSGGSSGTMVVNNNTNVGTQTISAASNVETDFWCLSSGLVGELVKITNKSFSSYNS